MSANPHWIPSRTITITVSAYNSGQSRMVRITGPSGETGMAPLDPNNWDSMTSWASDVVAGELGVALGQIDEETNRGTEPGDGSG